MTKTYDAGTTWSFYNEVAAVAGNPTWTTEPVIYGSVKETDTTDFGQPGVLRKDLTTYQWELDSNSNYLAANLLDVPATVTVQDGAGTQRAKTTYTYDEAAYLTPSQGLTQLGTPWGQVRGNATTVDHWLNSGSSDPITHTNYYDTGEVYKSIDASSKTTTFQYGQCNGASLTNTQYAGGQQTSATYDCNIGKVSSYTDMNSNSTSYNYDIMGRIYYAGYPDGGSKTLTYTDTPPASVQEVTVLGPPTSQCPASAYSTQCAVVTEHDFDGLGRTNHVKLLSDPLGVVTTDTVYDPVGQVGSVSNPYRTPAAPTDPAAATTSYAYDALGRLRFQCQPGNTPLNATTCVPSNSYLEWSYNGNTTTVYDELRNSQQQIRDGLGRLTNVVEDPNGLNLPTGYSYDTLGNLTGVTQHGTSGDTARLRSFTYDSLSRLVCASNPENSYSNCPVNVPTTPISGVTNYSYYPNGNLNTKTDSRNVTTTYTYDDNNLLTSKTYSGEKNPTPSTCYIYNSDNNSGKNTKGRLVAEWTQAGNCPSSPSSVPSNAVSWKDSMSYDAMGRLRNETQCALAPCTAPSPLQYVYDFIGNVTYANNGLAGSQSHQFGWTSWYDGAGRLSKVLSNWPEDPTHPGILFEADQSMTVGGSTYAPYGPFGLTAAQYGKSSTNNTTALVDARSYDIRGRLIGKSVLGTSAGLTPTSANVSMNPSTFTLTGTGTATIHVNCNSACGQVDIKADGNDLGLQSLDANGNVSISSSSFPASSLSVGNHTLLVLYLGNVTYASSSGSATYTVTTLQTTTTLSFNPSTFTTAEAPQVLANVSCNSACGQVSLSVDGHPWIPAYDVDSNGNYPGWANIWFWQSPYLTPGSHTITANYLGNATLAPSSGSTTVTINPIGTQQTSVNLSLDPPLFATVEDAVVSTHVGCNSACGQVLYTIDGNNWVVFNLDSNGNTGVNSYWWQSQYFTTGSHTLTANYLGNSTYAPVSQSSNFTIAPVGTQPANVTQTPNTTTFSPSDLFYTDINVGCNCAGSIVEVTVDGNQWVLLHLDDTGRGTASTTWAGNAYFTPGTHTVSVHFLGNTTYAPTDSNSVTVTVGPYK